MKTEVTRNYKWGFILSEQELRRISQTCHDHLKKNVPDPKIQIEAVLRDGSVIEGNTIDEILTLENAGSKRIQRVSLTYDDGQEVNDWKIFLVFEDAEKNPRSWTSIFTEVTGKSRDWAFLAAADIEERIKKIKSIAPAYIIENRWFAIVPVALSMLIFLTAFFSFAMNTTAADKLDVAYENGTIKDPIEAMIFLERAKQESFTAAQFLPLLALSMLLPYALFFGLGKLVGILAPSYNFYWGDYIAYLDRRKSAQNIIWTVVILGVIVSIISAYILRFLP